jgi:hypothetical protein
MPRGRFRRLDVRAVMHLMQVTGNFASLSALGPAYIAATNTHSAHEVQPVS